MSLNALDIVFIVCILFFAVRGVFRGFIGEIFSVGSLVAGVVVAMLFAGRLAVPLEQALGLRGWGPVVAFLVLFIAAYIVLKIVEKALRGIVESVHLQGLDKALGLVLGLVEGIALVGLAVFLLRVQPVFDFRSLLDRSVVAEFLKPLVAFGAETIQERMK